MVRPEADFMSRERAYPIGAVAARFDVAISTLRWWEKYGLLSVRRVSGQRRYDEAAIRRIALIQLMQRTAMMSLDEIAGLLAGSTEDGDWRAGVRARIAACDEQLARMTTARRYLAHLLTCPSEHPVDTCPQLAKQIDQTLHGRASGLVDNGYHYGTR